MARTKTNTVEYFPHVAKSGKTLFILEGKYGNDGYAFWFKLLEILALTEDHFYSAADETDWQYLVARARISDQSATEMLLLLANLGNIDADLWKNHKIIWCQALIDNLSEVYRKRKRDLPTKPKPINCDRNGHICDRNATSADISTPESTQSKVEESRVKEIKALSSPGGENGSYSSDFLIIYAAYPKNQRGSKKNAYVQYLKLKPRIPANVTEIIDRQIQEKNKADSMGIFYPEFKHLERWLKAQSWENEPFDFSQRGDLTWTRELSKQPSTN